jgi:carboxymethylenebutenolidase
VIPAPVFVPTHPIPTMKRSLLLFAAALIAAVSSASAQDWAKARLDKSPRHLEWVTIKHDGREVGCYVGYPEVKTKATAVVVIHEIFGHSDWVRLMVDELAEAGYIAIAPDLLWGLGAKGGGTTELTSTEIGQKIGDLAKNHADQITADLNAAADYVAKLDACNGKIVVAGFCWGGTQTFRYATNNPSIKAGLVFYGSAPAADALAKIKAPIYGFYAGNDARIGAGLPAAVDAMKAAGKAYEPITYDGAGHGFMRAGDAPDATEANKKARDASWARLKEIIGKL